MKLHHKINHGWERPSEPISDRYQAEIDASMRKAEKAWRKAQKAAERAERIAERKPEPATITARDNARAEMVRRYDELRRIEALMQQAPAGRSPQYQGRAKARYVNKNRSAL